MMRYKGKMEHIKNPTEGTQNECRRFKKAVARVMKEEAVKDINEIGIYPVMFSDMCNK